MKTESLTTRLTIDSWTIILRILKKIERKFNSITCWVMNGGHELYTIRNNPEKLFQQCLLCGHETKGWEYDEKYERKITK